MEGMKAPLAAGAGGRRNAAHAARPGPAFAAVPHPGRTTPGTDLPGCQRWVRRLLPFWWHLLRYFPPWWMWVWVWPALMILWVMGWAVAALGVVFFLGEGIRRPAGWRAGCGEDPLSARVSSWLSRRGCRCGCGGGHRGVRDSTCPPGGGRAARRVRSRLRHVGLPARRPDGAHAVPALDPAATSMALAAALDTGVSRAVQPA